MTTAATMTVKEAAARLRVSPKTVYELIEAEALPARRVGLRKGKILIDAADVEAYWDASKAGPKPVEIRSASRHLRPPSRARRPS